MAGPAGLVSALCLAQHGVASVIVERRTGLQTHPKAHELSARSIEILHGLGFSYDELAAEASPLADSSRILFCDTIAKEFGCIDLQTGPSAGKYRQHLAAPMPYLNISQAELEKVLVAHVQQCAQTELRYNQQWESFEQHEDRVLSRITNRATAEQLTIASRYVICADGAGSRSRLALGIKMIGPEKLQDFVNAYFEADLHDLVKTRGKLYFIFNPQVPGSVFVAHHIEKRWVYQLSVASPHEKIEDYTPEILRERIRQGLGRDDIKITITSTSSWRMTAQVADHFRSGRAFLVGDAAHRFPPTGGLGMNSGIGDTHNLSWKLAEVLRGRAAATLLDTYETERRPVIQANCDASLANFRNLRQIADAFGIDTANADKMAERLHTGLIATLPAPGQAWIRTQIARYGAKILARYDADPKTRQRVLAAIARQRPHFDRIGLDLGYVYEEGALLPDGTLVVHPQDRVSHYIPSTHPGARFPHFWLDGNRHQHSSHEWIDYRRSTLVLGAGLTTTAGRESLAAAADREGVRVVFLSDPPVPLSQRSMVHTCCEIAVNGALLIRPDGHVAWRQQSGVELSAALIESILVETGLRARSDARAGGATANAQHSG